MIAVSAGGNHVAGLRTNGTVIALMDSAVGLGESDNQGQCDVDAWTDIVVVCAGHGHTAGLRSNGTVVAVGENEEILKAGPIFGFPTEGKST